MLKANEVGVTMQMSLHGVEQLKKLLLYAKETSHMNPVGLPVSTVEFDVFMGMLDDLIEQGYKFAADDDMGLEPDTPT